MNTYYVHHTMKNKKPIPLNGSKCHLVLLSSVNISKIYCNKLCYYMYMYKVRTECKRERDRKRESQGYQKKKYQKGYGEFEGY